MNICQRVRRDIEAFVDGELRQSEKVAIDSHLHDCATCQSLLREQRRLSAELYRHFRPYTRNRDLRSPVLSHLPEMDLTAREVEAVNYRAKHPRELSSRIAGLIPALAGGIVLALGLVLPLYWPEEPLPLDTVGVVTHVDGQSTVYTPADTRPMIVQASDVIVGGSHIETNDNGLLLNALDHGSIVAMGHDTRATLLGARNVRLEEGKLYFDVGHADELFRVTTTEAVVTVYGTAFEVNARDGDTTVTVQRGVVFVESVSDPTRFRFVYRNEQVRTSKSEGPTIPVQVRADEWVAWADAIIPDSAAEALYAKHFGPRQVAPEFEGVPHYVSRTGGVAGVRLVWSPSEELHGYSDYQVLVSEYGGDSIAQIVVPGATFSKVAPVYNEKVYHELDIDPALLKGLGPIDVKLIPLENKTESIPPGLNVWFTIQ